MTSDRLQSGIRATAAIVFLLGALEVMARVFHVAPIVIEAPSKVLVEIVQNPDLYLSNSWVTLYEVLIGFVLASALGVVVAFGIVYSKFLHDTVYPIVLLLQIVPKVAVAPVLVLFMGFGASPKILIAVLIAFFPVVVNTAVGLREVDKELVDLVRVLDGNRIQEFFLVRIPNALPFIFSGLKLAITFAVIGAVIGEFVGANKGLGYLVILASSQLRTEMTYAAITLLSVIGLVTYGGVVLLERLVVPWAKSNELGRV